MRFALVRNHHDDFPGAQDLSHGHRNRLCRNIRHTPEPSLIHLLLPARVVEWDHQIRIVDFEVCGRIVECQVRILPNSDKRQIDRFALKFSPDFSDRTSRISVAVQEVISSDPRLADQSLEQILPKARRMRDGKSDVFVKVENFDATPVDAGSRSQLSIDRLGCPASGQGQRAPASLGDGPGHLQLQPLDRRPGQDDPLDPAGLEQGKGDRHGEIGLARAGRSMADNEIVFRHGGDVRLLTGRLGADEH